MSRCFFRNAYLMNFASRTVIKGLIHSHYHTKIHLTLPISVVFKSILTPGCANNIKFAK